MYTLGERIRYARKNILRLKQSALANKLGFSRVATISDYETNKRLPDITTLRKIASIGGVSLEWLLTGKTPVPLTGVRATVMAGETNLKVGRECFAVVKIHGKDYREGDGPVDCMLVPKRDYEAAPFAVRVESHAMSPTIINGAIVGIDRGERRPATGDIYAVQLDGEGITVRRVFTYAGGVVLRPDNLAFPELVVPSAEAPEGFIIGRVVWLYQRF